MRRLLFGMLLVGLATPAFAATATVQWTHNGVNVTGFEVERRTTGGTFSAVGAAAGSLRTYSDPANLAPGDYCWRVRGVNGTTKGPYGVEGCGTVVATPPLPAAPTTITITITVDPAQLAAPGLQFTPRQ